MMEKNTTSEHYAIKHNHYFRILLYPGEIEVTQIFHILIYLYMRYADEIVTVSSETRRTAYEYPEKKIMFAVVRFSEILQT